ncbi:MAG: hypothetical protein ACOY90_13300 [Candidatus Zhuqueibacterota bacterium]
MKKNGVILASILAMMIACAGSVSMLPAPLDSKNLLIGALIFDVNGYNDTFESVRKQIEVAIVGNVIENGEMKSYGQWAVTDENGYFFLANVPDGEYVIKGFRIHSIGADNLTISNDLINPREDYYELQDEDIIYLQAAYFDTQSNRRIVNFKHHVFTLHSNEFIKHEQYDELREVKLSTGELVSEPPVPQYFLNKFPANPWAPFLELE